MRKQRRSRDSMVGNMVGMGVGNLVGVGMMSASADALHGMEAGTAKTLAGTAVGLGGVALVGHNLGYVKKSLGSKKKGSYF